MTSSKTDDDLTQKFSLNMHQIDLKIQVFDKSLPLFVIFDNKRTICGPKITNFGKKLPFFDKKNKTQNLCKNIPTSSKIYTNI